VASSSASLELRETKMPERPRGAVDTSEVSPAGRTISVRKGGDLQAAIDEASPGDAIVLEPGATYQGPFLLRPKDGAGWIVISSRSAGKTLRQGQRVSPADA